MPLIFRAHTHRNRCRDQPWIAPSLLSLPSYSSPLSCKEGVRAFLLYCYLLFGSIVFSKQTHHWHLAALISAGAICLIDFNEIKKENFVGKLGKNAAMHWGVYLQIFSEVNDQQEKECLSAAFSPLQVVKVVCYWIRGNSHFHFESCLFGKDSKYQGQTGYAFY